MNTFIFQKQLYSDRAITKAQLKTIHADLVGLGYQKSYQEFYEDLAEYCEKCVEDYGLAEDAGLSSAETKPFLSGYLLGLLESLTQPELSSRIFALCSTEKKHQVCAKIPALLISRRDAVDVVLSVCPDLGEFLPNSNGQETIIGFAPPVYDAMGYPSATLYPREESILDVRIGKMKRELLNGQVSIEIAKVSLTVSAGKFRYEFPLYWNGQNAGLIETECIPADGIILVEQARLLTAKEYEPLAKSMLASRQGRKTFTAKQSV